MLWISESVRVLLLGSTCIAHFFLSNIPNLIHELMNKAEGVFGSGCVRVGKTYALQQDMPWKHTRVWATETSEPPKTYCTIIHIAI